MMTAMQNRQGSITGMDEKGTRHTGHWSPDKLDIEAEVNQRFKAGWHEMTVHWDGRPVAGIYFNDDGNRKMWIDRTALPVD